MLWLLAASQARVLPGSLDELLQQYDNPSTRPGLSAYGDGSGDSVEVQFYIDRFHGIDQRAQTWGLTGYMRAEWHDPRLAFNETAAMTPLLTLFPQQASRVWQPDLYYERYVWASSISAIDGYGESLFIYPNGRVKRSQQRSFTFQCDLILTEMPFDMQTCHWTLGLYSSLADQVRVRWANNTEALINWDMPRCSEEWAAVMMHQEDILQTYVGMGSYSYAAASIDFVRSNPWVTMNLYFTVGVILVVVSYSGAWINPMSTPARVALAVITILTVVHNYHYFSKTLPVIDASRPRAPSRSNAAFVLPSCVTCFEAVCVCVCVCVCVLADAILRPAVDTRCADERGSHVDDGRTPKQPDLQYIVLRRASPCELRHHG